MILSQNYVFQQILGVGKQKYVFTAIVMVEQNASESLEIAHRGYVFSIGEIVLEDTGKKLLSDEKIKKSFLGG